MPGPCLNSWQPQGCDWTVSYLWRSTNWLVHVDVIVLALMLVYVVGVVTHVAYRYHMARHGGGMDDSSSRKVASELSAEVGSLKSIALTAPYCGLVGACFGAMSIYTGIGMEKHAALAMISSRLAVALVTTAVGIVVAVPASFSYNFFRTRLDTLEDELASELQRSRCLAARRLLLRNRFSQLPLFAMIAAPGLAILVAVETPFFAPREPTGFGIDLVSDRCENDGNDRLIVLHITNAGELFLNTEPERWNNLAGRLSEIYNLTAYRTLYLFADNDLPFQTVADAIDIVNNAVTSESRPLDIRLRLITPKAMSSCALLPVATIPLPERQSARSRRGKRFAALSQCCHPERSMGVTK